MKKFFSGVWDLINTKTSNDMLLYQIECNEYFRHIIHNVKLLRKPVFLELLNKIIKEIIQGNQTSLKKIVIEGIPKELSIIRSILWRINLGYLPLNSFTWETSLEINRLEYYKYKSDFRTKFSNNLKKFKNFDDEIETCNELYISNICYIPEFQNKQFDQDFDDFLEDLNLIDIINKDLKRTRILIQYLNSLKSTKNSKVNSKSIEHHNESLMMILMIFAKKNKDIGYVQGMNEILVTIYTCFLNDNNHMFQTHLEADTYNCFSLLMMKLKPMYCHDKKHLNLGINKKLKEMKIILKNIEPDISMQLEKHNIDIELFCFRWYAVLFTQDLDINRIFRLWDILLVEDNICNFMSCLCISILQIKKQDILRQDFEMILSSLKSIESIEIEEIVKKSMKVKKDAKKIISCF